MNKAVKANDLSWVELKHPHKSRLKESDEKDHQEYERFCRNDEIFQKAEIRTLNAGDLEMPYLKKL